jgi:AcrR family transcriptional regulator
MSRFRTLYEYTLALGYGVEKQHLRRGSGEMSRRRKRLTAEAIIGAAIRIADSEGIGAVSIRRLAAEVGAPPMTLYSHISSKEELIALMVEQVIAEIFIEEQLPADWRRAVALIARRNYATMVNHPWFVQTASTQHRRFGPNATKVSKQAAAALAGVELEPERIWLIMGTINDYVLGHSLRAVTALKPEELEQPIAERDIAETPELASLPKSLRTRTQVERFEAGLRIVLEGIERTYFR